MFTTTAITAEHRRQYQEEGYFILERAVPPEYLDVLRTSADILVRLADEELDRKGVDRDHITHRGVRYHIAKKYAQAPRLSEFVFGDLTADICRATVGDTAYLFYDQYVMKCADKGIKFSWHQDSGYLGFPHRPYVTYWTAVDDMTLENGTARVLPSLTPVRKNTATTGLPGCFSSRVIPPNRWSFSAASSSASSAKAEGAEARASTSSPTISIRRDMVAPHVL